MSIQEILGSLTLCQYKKKGQNAVSIQEKRTKNKRGTSSFLIQNNTKLYTFLLPQLCFFLFSIELLNYVGKINCLIIPFEGVDGTLRLPKRGSFTFALVFVSFALHFLRKGQRK